MKSYLLFIAVFFASHAFTQNFVFKPTIGVNTSLFQIVGDRNNKEAFDRFKMRPGYMIGLGGELKFQGNISLEMSWLYDRTNGFTERVFHTLAAGSADFPYTREKFSLYSIKIPINIVIHSSSANKIFFGLGGVVKHYFESIRSGDIVDYPDHYSNRFTLETKNGGKTGVGLILMMGKDIKVKQKAANLKLNFDTDISQWQYPTATEYELDFKAPFKTYCFSLQLAFCL